MKYLYHYCSLKTLKKILFEAKYPRLKLSNVQASNDPSEGWLMPNFIKKQLEEVSSQDDPALEAMRIKCDILNQYNLYAICFTADRDEKFKWFTYGDRCQGVSLGFDFEEIAKYRDRTFLEFQKVQYEDLAKRREIPLIPSTLIEDDSFPFTKSYFYRNEKEYRLFLYQMKGLDLDTEMTRDRVTLITKPEITYYFNIKGLLKSVMLGPRCHLGNFESKLRNAAKREKLNFKILYSQVTDCK